MANISFLGLGNMGLAMATHLLHKGHHLSVFNRTASRADSLARLGARVCRTAQEASQNADAVISMVADDEASQAIWCGTEGALRARLQPGAFAIECSTLSRQWVSELSSQCKSRDLHYIDAPVTGLPDAAQSGKITLLVGAEDADLLAVRPILADLSANILHFGPVGTGTSYKLIINLMGAVQIASAAEGLAIAERAGLNMHAVAKAIATSQAASPQVIRNVQRMVADDHAHNIVFTSALRLKDVDYGLRLAREFGIEAPFGAVAGYIYRDLCARGYADVNESSVIAILRSQLGNSSR
jgi:3-hydroxyisobutyrate dehydrogenase